MRIGVPREVKADENRVGLTPSSVRELTRHGHEIVMEHDCAYKIGLFNEDYIQAGARVSKSLDEIYDSEMIVKVKEPQPEEIRNLRKDQILFTYLHLAPTPALTNCLLRQGCTAIAYETVTDDQGRLPLLAPMSEVAGRMSVQAGAHSLEIAQGGRGTLLGGVPGTPPAAVTVLGGGVVGMNAARLALGMGANVVILDINQRRLAELDLTFGPALTTIFSTEDAIHEYTMRADLVIGAVLVPGSKTPNLVSEDMVRDMPAGSVLVDVAIDQGGVFETSKATTHSHPTFVKHEVVHYCVANMPSAVARTSTFALNNVTLPLIMSIAELGLASAVTKNVHLRNGLNIVDGHVTHQAVAEASGREYIPAEDFFPSRIAE
ncbi:MAG: alanine dehydrogenase [Gammaproteobacteria bacterium]|nr:alanine dehydrogenase [Gammaproteobacteria bacterium]